MSALPFALRRPWLLMRDLFVDRDRPDLARLRATRSPEGFVWAVLPHAARTFSACIAMLPAPTARAAAVGYLYCRILDTYEDLAPSEERGRELLRGFARRFGRPEDIRVDGAALPAAPRLEGAEPVDQRDRAHLLLIECCDRIDAVYRGLPPVSRRAIVHLVRDMAGGMIWARRVFEEQGGVLRSDAQLAHYCHAVLGNPVAFAQRLMGGRELTPEERANAMRVGEFVQLANVTRDVEKDLARGIAYDPALAPHLGGPADPEAVRAARERMFLLALRRVPAYTAMLEQLRFRRFSLSRASALLMLEFTDRYYRACARRLGRAAWDGPRSSLRVLMSALPALLSQRRALKRARAIEAQMLAAADAPATAPTP